MSTRRRSFDLSSCVRLKRPKAKGVDAKRTSGLGYALSARVLPPMALHREVISHSTRAMEYTSACLKDSMFSRLILDSNTSGAMYLAVPT